MPSEANRSRVTPLDRRPVPLHVRLPRKIIAAIDAFADRCGITRSAAFRSIVCDGLSAHSIWPPPAETDDGRP